MYRLRTTLGAGLIGSTPNGYALGGGVVTDAAGFLASGDHALWRGAYLESGDPGGPAARELYAALRTVAEDQADPSSGRAVFLAELLLDASPFDQDLLRFALLTLQRGRAYRKLARRYAEQRTLLAEVGEFLPDRWQDFLDRRHPLTARPGSPGAAPHPAV